MFWYVVFDLTEEAVLFGESFVSNALSLKMRSLTQLKNPPVFWWLGV